MKQFVIGGALCLLLAWGVLREQPAAVDTPSIQFFAMGTLVQISSVQPLPSELVRELQNSLEALEQRWSVRGDGELAQLNLALQSNREIALPPVLKEGISAARKACLDSGGLFEPGVGLWVKLWGFEDESEFRQQPPPTAAIESAQQQRLCDALIDEKLRFSQAGGKLNFGASAKGRAVDILAQQLIDNGISAFIVNAGGDLKAMGQKPQRPWRIGIRHPRPEANNSLLAQLDVSSGEAVFSSGDYERFFLHQGQRYHHILDPRTGYPANAAQSSTVIHSNAEWADAASTALFVAGPELADSTMQNMGISLWLLVDAKGQVHASDAMRARLDELQQ
ncbi:MAG: FAD:protein FMN transferase [Oceanococcus sp.]